MTHSWQLRALGPFFSPSYHLNNHPDICAGVAGILPLLSDVGSLLRPRVCHERVNSGLGEPAQRYFDLASGLSDLHSAVPARMLTPVTALPQARCAMSYAAQ